MSHLTYLESTLVNDVASLKKTAANLGLQFVKNGQVRWHGGTKACDYVVKLPGSYDLGFNLQSDGKLEMVCDWYAGHVSRYVGEEGAKFVQEFNKVKISRDARRKGHSVRVKNLKDGRVKLFIGVR